MDVHITTIPYTKIPSTLPSSCRRIFAFGKILGIFFREAATTFINVIPNRIRWIFRTSCSSQIREQKISGLFTHHIGKSEKPALLFLHGDHSHPSTLLPLIDNLKTHTTFSMHVSYDTKNPKKHRKQIKNAIDFIANTKHCGPLILVGHSQGAIQSSYLAFVKQNPNIRAVVSIAGRLALPEGDTSCRSTLRPTIEKIESAIKERSEIPLYQIVAEKDWNAPREATCVRQKSATIIKNALHLNVLYYPQTKIALQNFLNSEKI